MVRRRGESRLDDGVGSHVLSEAPSGLETRGATVRGLSGGGGRGFRAGPLELRRPDRRVGVTGIRPPQHRVVQSLGQRDSLVKAKIDAAPAGRLNAYRLDWSVRREGEILPIFDDPNQRPAHHRAAIRRPAIAAHLAIAWPTPIDRAIHLSLTMSLGFVRFSPGAFIAGRCDGVLIVLPCGQDDGQPGTVRP